MTRIFLKSEDYLARREVFTAALDHLHDCVEVFLDLVQDSSYLENDEAVAEYLDEQGSHLSGNEYLRLKDAVSLLERLVGRSHHSSEVLKGLD